MRGCEEKDGSLKIIHEKLRLRGVKLKKRQRVTKKKADLESSWRRAKSTARASPREG